MKDLRAKGEMISFGYKSDNGLRRLMVRDCCGSMVCFTLFLLSWNESSSFILILSACFTST